MGSPFLGFEVEEPFLRLCGLGWGWADALLTRHIRRPSPSDGFSDLATQLLLLLPLPLSFSFSFSSSSSSSFWICAENPALSTEDSSLNCPETAPLATHGGNSLRRSQQCSKERRVELRGAVAFEYKGGFIANFIRATGAAHPFTPPTGQRSGFV